METRLHVEILGLLLQVAWADEQITDDERTQILERARAANLGDEQLARVGACLRGEAALPPPDLGYLRAHRAEALDAITKLMGDDGQLAHHDEVLMQIKEMLGGQPAD